MRRGPAWPCLALEMRYESNNLPSHECRGRKSGYSVADSGLNKTDELYLPGTDAQCKSGANPNTVS